MNGNLRQSTLCRREALDLSKKKFETLLLVGGGRTILLMLFGFMFHVVTSAGIALHFLWIQRLFLRPHISI